MVDVIIPVYKGLQQTRACIESVLRYGQSTPIEIVVIDDASPEPAIGACLREFAGRERITTGVFDSIARLVVSFARFPNINRENIHDWIRYEGLENFEQARSVGKGVLVATGHLGNWELSAFAHAYLRSPMHIVVRPIDNSRIDALVESRRQLSERQHLPGSLFVLRGLAGAIGHFGNQFLRQIGRAVHQFP